jgi:holo-[acyl-carrier protein] synthase
MIVGTGIDIIESGRVEAVVKRWGERFLRRIYVEPERKYCERKGPAKYRSYAARFAAKEAFLKAIGTGISQGFAWQDCWVESEPSGKPVLRFSAKAEKKLKSLGAAHCTLTLSHSKDLAVAMVVLES